MNRDSKAPVDRDALLETFAAELALAAHRVALRTRTGDTWLDLELDLWRALADTVKTWGEGIASVSSTRNALGTRAGSEVIGSDALGRRFLGVALIVKTMGSWLFDGFVGR